MTEMTKLLEDKALAKTQVHMCYSRSAYTRSSCFPVKQRRASDTYSAQLVEALETRDHAQREHLCSKLGSPFLLHSETVEIYESV